MMRSRFLPWCLVLGAAACSAPPPTEESTEAIRKLAPATTPYTLFETLQVRPLALSPSGKTLFAANTPDNRVEVFRVWQGSLIPLGSVAVGLEPIALAARSDDEVWVVNHLSDSVSIVKIDGFGIGAVTRTLLVGDEPRDIVFAGPGREKSRAFITTAHRGQNTGDPYDLQTPGVGRADVWVFDANNLGAQPGGQRLTKLTFFADTPRGLAVSPDGKRVYAAAFASGNQTTVASVEAVQRVYAANGLPPPPSTVTVGPYTFPQPPVGLVLKYKNGHWTDAYGAIYDPLTKVNLPDKDVFAIDATANPPAAAGEYAHVGTTLFNLAVNPKTGKVYVTNTEAHNDVRFEGHTPGFTSVRGHIADNRITVIDPASGTVTPRNLNPHINYDAEGSDAEKKLSVAFPQDLVFSRDGSTLYTVAQGSSKLVIYRTADLDAGDPTPSLQSQVLLSGGGPTGVVLDEQNGRAYVLTRFDNSIKTVDLRAKREIAKVAMYNPEPPSITKGRQYLYDATFTSAHGDSACASCHIGGDKDELAWDLGNPGGIPLPITQLGDVFAIPPAAVIALLPSTAGLFKYYMPLKGPMTTQSLRGMDNHGAMHWRGDRNGAVAQTGQPVIDPATGQPIVSSQPNTGIFDEVAAFTSFNVAFPGLVGRAEELSAEDMNAFATFILQASYPPNPIRNLDNSLTAEQQAGRAFYFNHVALPDGSEAQLPSDRFHNCNGCHTLDPAGNAGKTAHPGFFGTDGKLSFEFETQLFKVPHLRNMYTKVGMFGSSVDSLQLGTIILQQGPAQDAIRGFGFQHDGALGSLEHFFTGQVFIKATTPVTLADGTVVPPNPYGIPFIDLNTVNDPDGPKLVEDGGFALRHAIVAFMMAFDSNLAPIVGQQLTVTKASLSAAQARLQLLEARAQAGEADLVVKGPGVGALESSFLYTGGKFQPSSTILPALTEEQLLALTKSGVALTFTAVPPGEGQRIALDRDGDGWADGDELVRFTNPADPKSHP